MSTATKKKTTKRQSEKSSKLDLIKKEMIAQFLNLLEDKDFQKVLLQMKSKGIEVEIENIIFQTKHYDGFHFIKSNRDINRKMIEKWKKTIGEEGKDLDVPIIVDNKFGINDGQHKFVTRTELKLPVNFYVSKNITENDLSGLQNGKPWNVNDSLKHFVELEKSGDMEGDVYTRYQKIYNRYNDKKLIAHKSIQHNELRMLIMGYNAFSSATIHKPFNLGLFKFVRSEEEIVEFLDWMFLDLPSIISGKVVRNRYFQRSLVNLCSYENYERRIFLKMLKNDKTVRFLESRDFHKLKVNDKVSELLSLYNKVARKEGKKYVLK